MAQDLTVNIKTTSDVPQAMDKAKAATVSFDKQVQDIGRKFSTAFKDIALGFVAPMVIVQNIVSAISSMIEKAKQDAKEGLDLLAKGQTIYATDEEKKAANFFRAKKAREDEQELVMKGRAELARQFMDTKEGGALAGKFAKEKGMTDPEAYALYEKTLPHDKDFQKQALDAFLKSPEGKAYKPIFEDQNKPSGSAGTFKGPEGFGAVIGVGANPVIENMTKQTEIQTQLLKLLEGLLPPGRPANVPDFTKAVPLTLQKSGLV